MIQKDNINGPSLMFMLIMLGVISPFALQIFLPSMPGLVVDFDASHGAVQLTISLYVGAFAFAQLDYGPLSDRFGRRRVILMSPTIYIVAPLICATAQSIEVLVAGRMLQAIGGCAGLMLSWLSYLLARWDEARNLDSRSRAGL